MIFDLGASPALDLIHHGGEIRTKQSHPYSYDPIRYYSAAVGGVRGSAYDDRMEGWDREKFNRCIEAMRAKNPSCGWMRDYSNPQWTRDFLRMYWDEPLLEVTDIVEYCNQATGYPCWYFEWVAKPTDEKPPQDC
jgi:hypothetical protein